MQQSERRRNAVMGVPVQQRRADLGTYLWLPGLLLGADCRYCREAYTEFFFTIKDSLRSNAVLIHPQGAKRFINSWRFGRLDGVRQLGMVSHIWPQANHSRKEHCLGVGALSWEFLSLTQFDKDWKDEARIPRKLKLCLYLAGVLHDIGHGPYSHQVEEMVPDFDHEVMGLAVMDQMVVEDEHIVDHMRKMGMDGAHWQFIKQCIFGAKKWLSHDCESSKICRAAGACPIYAPAIMLPDRLTQAGVLAGDWLSPSQADECFSDKKHTCWSQLITGEGDPNADETDLSVDRLDYLERDSHYCGGNTWDIVASLRSKLRIVERSGERDCFAYRATSSSLGIRIRASRFDNHDQIYKHRQVLCINEMVRDTLEAIKMIPWLNIGPNGACLTFEEALLNPVTFGKLQDDILNQFSNWPHSQLVYFAEHKENIFRAIQLINKMKKRDFYQRVLSVDWKHCCFTAIETSIQWLEQAVATLKDWLQKNSEVMVGTRVRIIHRIVTDGSGGLKKSNPWVNAAYLTSHNREGTIRHSRVAEPGTPHTPQKYRSIVQSPITLGDEQYYDHAWRHDSIIFFSEMAIALEDGKCRDFVKTLQDMILSKWEHFSESSFNMEYLR